MGDVTLHQIGTLEHGGEEDESRWQTHQQSNIDNSKPSAFGKYQITLATAKQYGFDDATPEKLQNDDDYNTKVAQTIVDHLNSTFQANSSVLVAYNDGIGTLHKWQSANRDNSVLKDETVNYMKMFQQHGWSLDGPTQQAAAAPNWTDLETKIATARKAGYGWDEINSHIQGQWQAAKQAGYSDADIKKFLGEDDVASVDPRIHDRIQAATHAQPDVQAIVKGTWEKADQDPFLAFKHAVMTSVIGRGVQAVGGTNVDYGNAEANKLPVPDYEPTKDQGEIAHLAGVAGQTLGDLPWMITGGLFGGAPGAFALPAAVRDEYNEGVQRSAYKTPMDYVKRQGRVAVDVAANALLGKAIGLTGELTGGAAKVLGASDRVAGLTRLTSELGTMVTGNSLLQGKLPSSQDWIDGTLGLLGFKAALHLAGATTSVTRSFAETVKKNLGDHFVKTGESPTAAAARAIQDPDLRQDLITQQMPKPKIGDSYTNKEFLIAHDQKQAIPPGRNYQFPQEEAQLASHEDFRTNAHKIRDEHEQEVMRLETEGYTGAAEGLSKSEVDEKVEQRVSEARDKMLGMVEQTPKKAPLDRVKDMAYSAYLNLFNYEHPLQKLSRAASQGSPLSGAEDPLFMNRLAENSSAVGQQMLREGVYRNNEKIAPGIDEWYDGIKPGADTQSAHAYLIARLDQDIQRRAGIRQARAAATEQFKLVHEHLTKANARLADIQDEQQKIVEKKVNQAQIDRYNKILGMSKEAYAAHDEAERNVQAAAQAVSEGGSWKAFYRAMDKRNKMALAVDNLPKDMLADIDAAGRLRAGKAHNVRENAEFKAVRENYASRAKAQAKLQETQHPAPETGIDHEAAKTVIREWSGNGRYEPLVQKMLQFHNAVLLKMMDAGIVSKDEFTRIVTGTDAYFPLLRTSRIARPTEASRQAGYSKPKELKGSESKFLPPDYSSMRLTFRRVSMIARAEANKAAIDAAVKLGVAAPAKENATFSAAGILSGEHPDQDTGMFEDESDVITNALKQLQHAHMKEEEVPRFENGQVTKYVFEDPHIHRILNGLDAVHMSSLLQPLATMSHAIRSLITSNPMFPLRILSYDLPFQAGVNNENRNSLASFYQGLGMATRNPEMYNRWIRSGGADHVFNTVSKDAYIKDVMKGRDDPTIRDTAWNLISKPYTALQGWSRLIMSSLPAGRFERGIKAGETEEKAGFESTQAKFHRPMAGGAWSRTANLFMPFTTAYFNSIERSLRAMAGQNAKGEFSTNRLIANHAILTSLITIPMLMNWNANKDQEWYKAQPDYKKYNGLFFPMTRADGKVDVLYWKYPPILSTVYGNIPLRIAQAFHEHDTHALNHDFLNSMGYSLVPQSFVGPWNVAMPVIEHIANYSFFKGHSIEPSDSERGHLPPERYSPYTTQTSRVLSKAFSDVPLLRGSDLSPAIIDNYINQWGGTWGNQTIRAIESATHANNIGPPPTTEEKIPFLNSWMTRWPTAYSQPEHDFRDMVTHYNEVHGSLIEAMKARDFDRFKQIVDENREEATLHSMKMRYETRKDLPPDSYKYLSYLNSQRGNVDELAARTILVAEKAMKRVDQAEDALLHLSDQQMPPVEKRQLYDRILSYKQMISERALEAGKKANFHGY